MQFVTKILLFWEASLGKRWNGIASCWSGRRQTPFPAGRSLLHRHPWSARHKGLVSTTSQATVNCTWFTVGFQPTLSRNWVFCPKPWALLLLFLARLAPHPFLEGTADSQQPRITCSSETSAWSFKATSGEMPALWTQRNICDLRNNLQGTKEMDSKEEGQTDHICINRGLDKWRWQCL